MSLLQTAERVSDTDLSDNYVFQRSILAYDEAMKLVSGDVLEIGTGSGYGIEIIAPRCNRFVTIDKFRTSALDNKALMESHAVEFIQMTIPPLKGIADNTFDYVITFQVIEHIQDDGAFVSEIHRVLKPGGQLIVTTPNIKTSLTRNPWHIREYTTDQLDTLLSRSFTTVKRRGTFGNKKVNDYIEANKASIRKITRFDILNLQYRLPRQLLQIPYDILNRMNRKKLLDNDNSLVSSIKMTDFKVAPATEDCLDLFYIATK